VHIECVTPPLDRFLGHGTTRHNAGEVRETDEISATFIFGEPPDLAPWKILTRLLELRRHGNLRLIEGVFLAPEPAVVIDDPVPAIGTALHLDLEPTLLTVRHGRRPQRALRILRLPFDRHTARPL